MPSLTSQHRDCRFAMLAWRAVTTVMVKKGGFDEERIAARYKNRKVGVTFTTWKRLTVGPKKLLASPRANTKRVVFRRVLTQLINRKMDAAFRAWKVATVQCKWYNATSKKTAVSHILLLL